MAISHNSNYPVSAGADGPAGGAIRLRHWLARRGIR
jgi:hypothetical protein